MNTPFDLEDRLRETFDDVVPQLIARARATQEVALIGESAPPRPVVAGTPRRWSLLGAVAAVVLLVGAVWLVSRSDDEATAPSASSVASTVPSSDDPAWYTLLRPYVPERYRYLALVWLADDSAQFEAIDPNDPVYLVLRVRLGADPIPPVVVTCDDGCDQGTTPLTAVEQATIEGSTPAEPLVAAAQHADLGAIDQAAVTALVAPDLSSTTYTGPSLTLSTSDSPRMEVHVVSGIWPVNYNGGGEYWAMSNTFAVRVTTADRQDNAARTLLAYKVLIAAQGTQTSTVNPTFEPEWYTILRGAVPSRVTWLALTRIEPHLATFAAFDKGTGEFLEIIVRDVPGPAVVVTCAAMQNSCTLTADQRDAISAAIPPGALGAAARAETLERPASLATDGGWHGLLLYHSFSRSPGDVEYSFSEQGGRGALTVRVVVGQVGVTDDFLIGGDSFGHVAWGARGEVLVMVTGAAADVNASDVVTWALDELAPAPPEST